MALQEEVTRYYDYIDTCYECSKCGKKKYVKGVKTYTETETKSNGTDVFGNHHFNDVTTSSNNIRISDDGYYHINFENKRGLCPGCAKKRILKFIIIIGIVVVVILGMSFADTLITSFVGNNSSLYEAVFTSTLEKYENHEKILVDVQTKYDPGVVTIDEMKEDLQDSDYYLNLYAEGSAEIQKHTLGDETWYYFNFGANFGDLSDKKYAISGELIYEIGKEKKVYYKSSAEYAPMLAKLNVYLPENCLGKGPYITESWLTSADDEISAKIAYGDNITVLYDSWNGYYFEKTSELFARLQYNETGSKSTMFNLPKLEDCTEIR